MTCRNKSVNKRSIETVHIIEEIMKKIYFVILNYNTVNETRACVDSIRKLNGSNFQKHIIVIDNASTDSSFMELTKKFSPDKDVEFYRMKSNLGFSKGNNYGYQVVREKEDADFCIICNSDIEFVQEDFLIRLEREFDESYFHVFGPDVYCESRKKSYCKGHQSPMYPFEWNKRYINTYQHYYELLCKKLKNEHFSKIKAVGVQISMLGCIGLRKISTGTFYRNYRKKYHKSVPLHGSCIVVSKLFIEKERILFWPEKRFYGEELLLYLRCIRNDYKIVFNPELLVHHLQGKATSSINDDKQINLFRYENFAIAAKTYLEELERENHQ